MKRLKPILLVMLVLLCLVLPITALVQAQDLPTEEAETQAIALPTTDALATTVTDNGGVIVVPTVNRSPVVTDGPLVVMEAEQWGREDWLYVVLIIALISTLVTVYRLAETAREATPKEDKALLVNSVQLENIPLLIDSLLDNLEGRANRYALAAAGTPSTRDDMFASGQQMTVSAARIFLEGIGYSVNAPEDDEPRRDLTPPAPQTLDDEKPLG